MTLPADFVVPVDKPEGPTSHDVVGAVRRALGRRRVGHTGTLDPFASGLLLVCVGRATRLAEYLSALDKTYEAVARLGEVTDTLDRDGEVLERHEGPLDVDRARVEEVLRRFKGHQEQVPPAFSAKKIGGEAAYRRARRGESVTLAPAPVTVLSLAVTSFEPPLVSFRVRCSSGTYIRALARDMGAELGVGAHLIALRRTEVGGFGVGRAVGVDELTDEDAIIRAAIRPLDALAHLPVVSADADQAAMLTRGRSIPVYEGAPGGLVAVSHEGALLAVGESGSGVVKPRKVFGA